jgi:putative oxidoreductase
MKPFNRLFSLIIGSSDDFKSVIPRLIVGLCGIMVLTGLLTRIASIPLLIIMGTAIITTKIPKLVNDGFWTMAHDSRTDFAMTLLLLFLIIYGAGKLSFDSMFQRK